MYILLSNKIFITLLGILLISGCGGRPKKDDLDLSDFIKTIKPIQQSSQNDEKTNNPILEKKEVELKDLIPLKDREDISNSIKYGKQDPFSPAGNELNRFIEDFKLKGFISFKNKDHALVEYKKQKGIIDLNSVGGVNTTVLPKKAFVRDINPSQEEIYLSIEGEIYTIKLDF